MDVMDERLVGSPHQKQRFIYAYVERLVIICVIVRRISEESPEIVLVISFPFLDPLRRWSDAALTFLFCFGIHPCLCLLPSPPWAQPPSLSSDLSP